MLGLSLHGWENSMVAFLIVAGLFALLAGAATWVVVGLQRIEISESKRELDAYKAEAAERISAANALSDAAKADATKAIAETAKANERTAELRLELEERKNRKITDGQRAAVIERLKPLPKGKIIFNPLMGDGEAFQFSDQIQEVLKEAGYPVEEVPLKDRLMMLNRTGVFLWMKDAQNPPERAKNIATAFRLVGVTMWGESNLDFTDPDQIMIVVSTHP
jgi:hypothetical protein